MYFWGPPLAKKKNKPGTRCSNLNTLIDHRASWLPFNYIWLKRRSTWCCWPEPEPDSIPPPAHKTGRWKETAWCLWMVDQFMTLGQPKWRWTPRADGLLGTRNLNTAPQKCAFNYSFYVSLICHIYFSSQKHSIRWAAKWHLRCYSVQFDLWPQSVGLITLNAVAVMDSTLYLLCLFWIVCSSHQFSFNFLYRI